MGLKLEIRVRSGDLKLEIRVRGGDVSWVIGGRRDLERVGRDSSLGAR